MIGVDEKMLGFRIREARERAGLTQGELGRLTALDRTAVNRIESGLRKVTAIELSDIATALGVRMASFFADPVPAVVSHRSSQGLDTADSQIDALLAHIAAEVEFVQALAPAELGLPSERVELPRPHSLSDAEGLAVAARSMLGLTLAQPVHELVAHTASVGLLAFSINLGVDTADAGTILLRQGGVCLVNSHSKVGRRRLALAHELGHYLIADEYTVDWRVSEEHTGEVEARLDLFARALLLPEPGVTAAWVRHGSRDPREAAVLLASEFRVDMATLARRLQELGLVDGSDATRIRGFTTTRSDIIDFGLQVPTDLEGTSLPVPFQKAVLRAFRDERVSQARAIELLRDTLDEVDLPPLRSRREDEIWNFVS